MVILKRLWLVLGGLLAVIAVFTFYANTARAESVSPWIVQPTLNLQKLADFTEIPTSLNGNIDCFAGPNATCTTTTNYGTLNTAGSLRLFSAETSYPIYSFIDNRKHFIAIPNSNSFITYTTEPPYGVYLYFNYNFSNSISLIDNLPEPYYQVNRPPEGKLVDKTNQRMAADTTSISFSSNGKWMVVSSPNIAMLRVNLQTFEVLPFAPAFDYSIGLSPAPQTAISNDGRYAAVASKDFVRFRLYDLDSCGSPPASIIGPVSCQSRDLQNLVQREIPGFRAVSNLRFINNESFSFYAGQIQDNKSRTAKYILSSSVLYQQDYMAVGDSYISGEGAFSYLPGTDTPENKCHLSTVSYPLLMGNALNFNSFRSVACSGALIDDITDQSGEYRGQAKPRTSRDDLDKNSKVGAILANFQPGYINQLEFVKRYQPKIITISLGGNDVGFTKILTSCVLSYDSCYSTYEDRLELVRQINNRIFPKLVQTYQTVKNNGPAGMRVYVIPYPQIALQGGNCGNNVRLNSDELIFSRQLIEFLDNVIERAAAKAGVFYVDTQSALNGHRLCEAGPGSIAMNGLTAGNDSPGLLNGPIGSESYHPNWTGHQLLESSVLSGTNNLTVAMPDPNPAQTPPSEAGLEILNAPRSGREVKNTQYNPNLVSDSIYRQVPTLVTINGGQYGLTGTSTLQAELHSLPLGLGSFTTDSNGNLNTQITIPKSVPTGYHSLHFLGTDINGQKVDIYKYLYIAATADDLDGNGIVDSRQKCIGLPSSGVDVDRDGIDDACDGMIEPPPLDSKSEISGNTRSPTPALLVSTQPPAGGISSTKNQILTEKTSIYKTPAVSGTNKPAVLGAAITKPPLRHKTPDTKNFRTNSIYLSGGLSIFLLSLLAYALRGRIHLSSFINLKQK